MSGNRAGNVHRSRHSLNADTIREMHRAFQRGGRKAIDVVMKNQPAVFLKLLVLLVPRELKVDQNQWVKGMSDEAIEACIAAIETMLAARAGEAAKVEGTSEPAALPAPEAQSIAGHEPERHRARELYDVASAPCGGKVHGDNRRSRAVPANRPQIDQVGPLPKWNPSV